MKDYFLADDLSGALDAAGAFHHAGRRVRIVLAEDGWDATEEAILGVTTETRNAAPDEAAARVTRALLRGQAQGARLRYKKIDSTLRGAVGAELAALHRTLPGARILFCPANPAVGRTVRGGRLFVHGVPVHETEFARDPICPVRESDLRRLLDGAGSDNVLLFDAATEADLAAAVAHQARLGGAWVAVGSGALARPVAELDGAAAHSGPAANAAAMPAGPVLMLCGSAHAANRAQAAELTRARDVPAHELSLTAPGSALERVAACLHRTGGASLLVEETRHPSGQVLRLLTSAAATLLAGAGVNRLFVTGGETAYAVCRTLGIDTLDYAAELEPGVSLSRGRWSGGPLLLANKPGGFGTTGTWVRVWDALRGRD